MTFFLHFINYCKLNPFMAKKYKFQSIFFNFLWPISTLSQIILIIIISLKNFCLKIEHFYYETLLKITLFIWNLFYYFSESGGYIFPLLNNHLSALTIYSQCSRLHYEISKPSALPIKLKAPFIKINF